MSEETPTRWTPGAGWERVKRELPGIVPSDADIERASAALDEQLTRVDEAQRRVDEIMSRKPVGSAPISEEPARPACPACAIEPHDEPDANHIHRTEYGFLLYAPGEVLGFIEEVYAGGISEGRRQALREESEAADACALALDTLDGQEAAAEFYRLQAEHLRNKLAEEGRWPVGPWEPTEHPGPARGVGWRLARDEEIQAAVEQPEDGSR